MGDPLQADNPLHPVNPVPPGLLPRPAQRGRPWIWGGVLLIILLTGAVVTLVGWSGHLSPTGDRPLTGELTVVIRPGDSRDTLLVDEPGAVPVRAGAGMSLQVNFSQPLCAYLVWLDSQGQVVPLYPWNNDRVEVEDTNQPPPARVPAKVVLSPATASGWAFGRRGGLETVLLLARRTPLGSDVQLGSLLSSLPPNRMRRPDEVAVLGLDRGSDAVSHLLTRNRGAAEEAREVDQPLLERLDRLRDHFELIRVVRFAHDGD